MFASLWLLGSLLAPAQMGSPALPPRPVRRAPESPQEWLLTPQLAVGHELVYRGTYTEQALGRHVQLNRNYQFENRVLVMESGLRGIEVVVLTLFRDDSVAGGKTPAKLAVKVGETREAKSSLLEQVKLDLTGRFLPPAGVSLTVPLEGPPTLECGFSVPVPKGRIAIDKPWTVQEAGRPEMTWRVAGTEIIGGSSCLRLTGEQKSEDWDKPKGDRMLWRRQDVVWMSLRTGMADRVERRIEHRMPGRPESELVSTLRYDLWASPKYPSSLRDDLRRDILQTVQLQLQARPLMEKGSRGSVQLDTLIARAKAYLDAQTQTPYSEALVQLKQRMEAARRGEPAPPTLTSMHALKPVETTTTQPLAVGKPAPTFLAGDLTKPGESIDLRRLQGRPTLLIFYHPSSQTLDDLMAHINELTRIHNEVRVVGLVMTSDAGLIGRQVAAKRWKIPVLNASALRGLYGVEFTPRLVMIDAGGIVQGVVDGWGTETTTEIEATLKKWLHK